MYVSVIGFGFSYLVVCGVMTQHKVFQPVITSFIIDLNLNILSIILAWRPYPMNLIYLVNKKRFHQIHLKQEAC